MKKRLLNSERAAIVLALLGLLMVLFPWDILHSWKFLGFTLNTIKYGELGDFIGGVSAPFLALSAFFLLYKTYLSQKEELKETRGLLSKQQFETTFFSLLEAHINSVRNLSYRDSEGREIFGSLIFEAYQLEILEKLDFKLPEGVKSLEEYQHAYDPIYYQFIIPFESFLATLNSIAHFIERQNLSDNDAKFYYSIIASQLTITERLILQYHIKLRLKNNDVIHKRIKRILWKTGTITLSEHHKFISDEEISSPLEEEQ